MFNLPKIIIIVGPTASGKTALGLELAKKYNGEIVNADSRQVYKGMDIGTAKVMGGLRTMDYGLRTVNCELRTYLAEGIQHHLIDVVSPDEEFTLAHYKKLAFEAIDDILKRGKLPIVVGGTGLYIWAVVDNLVIPAVAPNSELRAKLEKKSLSELAVMLEKEDPLSAKKIDLKNPRRVLRALEVALSSDESFVAKQKKLAPKYDALQIGLSVERDDLVRRINNRVDEQIRDGLVDEVKNLVKKLSAPSPSSLRDTPSPIGSGTGSRAGGDIWTLPAMSGIGYKQIGYFLHQEMSLDEAVEEIKKATRRYAKRQMTWFRRDKRIRWVKGVEEAEESTNKFLIL